jgi:hypothetical protein
MNTIITFLGFAVILYVTLWILYMIFAFIKIYYEKYKYLIIRFLRYFQLG